MLHIDTFNNICAIINKYQCFYRNIKSENFDMDKIKTEIIKQDFQPFFMVPDFVNL